MNTASDREGGGVAFPPLGGSGGGGAEGSAHWYTDYILSLPSALIESQVNQT